MQLKFTPRGGRVQIRSQRIDSHVEIVVTDSGKGIEPNVLPVIFDRFRQGGAGQLVSMAAWA
jgi:signal transduction histidine kinase